MRPKQSNLRWLATLTLTIVKAITRVVMKEMSGCISLRRSRSMPVIVTNDLLPKLTGGLSRFVFFIFQQDGVPPTYMQRTTPEHCRVDKDSRLAAKQSRHEPPRLPRVGSHVGWVHPADSKSQNELSWKWRSAGDMERHVCWNNPDIRFEISQVGIFHLISAC